MGALFFRYQREFGFTIEGRLIVVDDIRVRGIGKSLIHTDSPVATAEGPPRVDRASCWLYYAFCLPKQEKNYLSAENVWDLNIDNFGDSDRESYS
jgi:hypothetical protein